MAAEVQEDLNKAQKRELKWERKQAKIKAAAEAAGQTYLPPPKEEKNSPTDKMGKRKKRKLAALQLDGGADAATPSSSNLPNAKSKDSKQKPDVLANGSTMGHADGTADQSKAEKKAAKKAKKASLADATAVETAPAATGAASTVKPKKKKKKSIESSISTDAAQASDSQPASSAPSKKQKKAAASAAPTPTPHGRVRAHQEAVLASVGDQELAKSGKTILKDLYQEHPSVTNMATEEVAKHRADRDTAVTGVDLRPVLEFDQAGSRAPPSSASCAFCIVFAFFSTVLSVSSTLSLKTFSLCLDTHNSVHTTQCQTANFVSMLCVLSCKFSGCEPSGLRKQFHSGPPNWPFQTLFR